MTRSDKIILKTEFDKMVRYFDKRGDKLTKEECLQEIGALRLFIYNLPVYSETNKPIKEEK